MAVSENNYAFIDANNLHLSVSHMGWKLDYTRFRIYLREKYGVTVAYYFIGEVPGMETLYEELRNDGYTLVFKPPIKGKSGRFKGNVDAELVMQAMIDIDAYDGAVIVTSDGDFCSLVKHLIERGKLKRLLASSRAGCSRLLLQATGANVDFVDDLRMKLSYRERSTP